MKEQNIRSHARYVAGFHFLTSALIFAAFVIAVVLLLDDISLVGFFYVLISISCGLLFFYLRRFSTKNQDRIIRTEENFRSYRLSGKILNQTLTINQVIALRFASDDEFLELLEKTVKENLKPADIKKEIKNWRADHHRV